MGMYSQIHVRTPSSWPQTPAKKKKTKSAHKAEIQKKNKNEPHLDPWLAAYSATPPEETPLATSPFSGEKIFSLSTRKAAFLPGQAKNSRGQDNQLASNSQKKRQRKGSETKTTVITTTP